MAIAATGGIGGSGASSTGGSIDVSGLTINEDDLVVAIVHVNQTGQGITDNNGANSFTVRYDDFASGATSTATIVDRVAGASEPSSYAWTWNNSTHWSIVLMVFSGVDTTTPWDTAPSASTKTSTASASSLVMSSVTTSVDGCYGIAFAGCNNTSVADLAIDNSYGNVQEHYTKPTAMWYKAQASAGGLGTTTVTPDITSDIFTVHSALQPAPGITLTDVANSGETPGSGTETWNDGSTGNVITGSGW